MAAGLWAGAAPVPSSTPAVTRFVPPHPSRRRRVPRPPAPPFHCAGPTEESNWVIPGRILVGAYPSALEDELNAEILSSILRLGACTRVFVVCAPRAPLTRLCTQVLRRLSASSKVRSRGRGDRGGGVFLSSGIVSVSPPARYAARALCVCLCDHRVRAPWRDRGDVAVWGEAAVSAFPLASFTLPLHPPPGPLLLPAPAGPTSTMRCAC